MAEIANRVRQAGQAALLPDLLSRAAKTRTAKGWDALLAAVDTICTGVVPMSAAAKVTVRELGASWRSGDLHREHPDHVKPKDATRDEQVARIFVDPEIGDMPVAEVTLDDCDRVMQRIEASAAADRERRRRERIAKHGAPKAKLPPSKAARRAGQRAEGTTPLAPATRRQVAQYLRRLLGLAVYPCRIRTANPIPKGWLPRVVDRKAKTCLYPSEDRALLACPETPVVRRLAFGFLAREGMRAEEALSLTWACVDLEHGRVELDENKTDDPRGWDLDPGVARALAAWRARFAKDAEPGDRVFVSGGVPLDSDGLAEQLRTDLQRAGVTRPQLFERSATRQPLRAHDLRATFVTTALATGRSEAWVCDRTGHRSSVMLNRYRRKARTWNLGPLDALDVAIPELAPLADEAPPSTPNSGRERDTPSSRGAISGDPGARSQLGNGVSGDPRIDVHGSKSAGVTPREGSSPSFGTAEIRADRRAAPTPAESTGHVPGPNLGQTAVDLDRAVALAAAVEALSSGPARTLAGELRGLLEDARGSAAEVVSLASRRRGR